MRRLLGIGLTVLTSFIARHGDGDSGPTVETPDGRTLQRLPEPHVRRYVSIFGELLIPRVVYGTREGQEIESVPLDGALGLPEGEFSYVLEDWVQRFCLKESFAEASRSLETLLGLRLYSRTLEHMNQSRGGVRHPVPGDDRPTARRGGRAAAGRHRRRQGRADAPPGAGRTEAPTPPPPHPGEKANKKQMACVGAVYSIKPFVRTADDILDEVLRKKCAKDRPRPQHKHVWAEMTREIEGEEFKAKDLLFCQLHDELALRQFGDETAGDLPDGRRAGAVGGAAGVLLRRHRGAGPVPRHGAVVGGGALLPQGRERRGQGVRGGATAGVAGGPGRVRHRRLASAVDQGVICGAGSGRWWSRRSSTWRTTGST